MTDPSQNQGPRASAVVGLQWGDEGKGKLVDLLAPDHDAVVRYNGGANAGHTVVAGGERYALHLVPSGILAPGVLAVIGNGVVVDPERLLEEIDGLAARGVDTSGLVVSDRAHVVAAYHKAEDELREALLARAGEPDPGLGGKGPKSAVSAIGTTKRGIGPAYADKVQRASAVRVGDLVRPEILRAKVELACALKNSLFTTLGPDAAVPVFDPAEVSASMLAVGQRLAPMIRETSYLLHDLLADGKRVLFEGANATMLDVDHGTFPYVTSSNASALGIGPGTGVPAQRVERVIGVVKAYSTRVGGGPMATELDGPVAEQIRERGREFGTTTGRPRRVGWLDLVAVRYAAMISGATELCVTLLDVLGAFDELKVCTRYRLGDGTETDRFTPDGFVLAGAAPVYETVGGFGGEIDGCRSLDELPAGARAYLAFVESRVGVPIRTVSVGPDRAQTIVCEDGAGAGLGVASA